MTDKCIKQLSSVRTHLITKKNATFFISLILRIKVEVTDTVSTAATNGLTIKFNPDFFDSLTKDERLFVYLHEILHIIYEHLFRIKNRDRKTWNYAADYVVNYALHVAGFIVPKGALIDAKYADMTVEEVYNLLVQEGLPKETEFSMDDLEPSETTPEQVKEIQSSVQRILIDAATQTALQNEYDNIPKDIQRLLSSLTKPKLNWRVVLKRLTYSLSNSDINWARPNRRYLPMYLPTKKSPHVGNIDFAIDTSGSVTEKMFNSFCSEIHAALKTVKPKNINVIQFNTKIKSVTTVKTVKDFMYLKFTDNDGTSVQPVFDYFNTSKSKALIIITDGYFYNPNVDPKRPVIWVIYDNPDWVAPFGKVVHLPRGDL